MKKVRKLVNICLIYGQELGVLFFDSLYVTVERPSVRVSHRSTATAPDGFAAERPAGRRYIIIRINGSHICYTNCCIRDFVA